jgi:hypothetical protein
VLAAAGLGCLLAGWNAFTPSASALSPSESIALRFPDSRFDAWDNVGSLATSTQNGEDETNLFNPHLTVPAGVATVATILVTPEPTTTAARPEPRQLQAAAPDKDAAAKAPMKLASVNTKPALPPAPRTRPGAVLNDAQIASIRSRLKLTQDQQEMWPAVESALRGLSYAKKSDDFGGRRAAAQPGTIDPSSSEVQQLKSAAFPLIMSFSDEQKRELRIIAHVAGLEKLAAQF